MTLFEKIFDLRRTLFRVLSSRLSTRSSRPLLQLRVLRAIARGRSASQAEVADCLMIDAGALSRILDRLEADGLLLRREGKDRRSLSLELTPAARLEVEAFGDELRWLDQLAQQQLSEAEMEAFFAVLDKLQLGFGDCLER